ncbi:hypothetical protein GGQ64_000497 [Rhizobium azooxidifex]|jgi:hypothetical protein|uniref:Uncharacterized protein n=1 Tax=Mycoplana azooxidifex TaxID=1636188 RepID=A0A7W6D245_9HYPH|nr:hypothetical protein [Mycoplana azooxidifex]MBB3975321.1 hypothetical protein [Mycoplana azooxidifex]
MNTARHTVRAAVLLASGAALLGTLSALAFAGWLEHGSSILLSMAETGMSWCF